LSPEDQKYYDNYFDVFATTGWRRILRFETGMKMAYDSILERTNAEEI